MGQANICNIFSLMDIQGNFPDKKSHLLINHDDTALSTKKDTIAQALLSLKMTERTLQLVEIVNQKMNQLSRTI